MSHRRNGGRSVHVEVHDDRAEDPVEELLLPRTDGGVAVQAALASAAVAALAWRVRGDRDLLRLVLGGGMFLAGLFVLRAMH